MRVTTLAHSSVLIECGAARILVDPIFADTFASDTLVFRPPRALDAEGLIRTATALVVTHIHLDHFHPPTLERFPRSLPIIVPPHDALVGAIKALGFMDVTPLEPWSRHDIESGQLLATPSDFETEEFGLVARHGESSYWHMSDAIVTEAVGRTVRETVGPVSLVSVKHQPLRTLIAYQRGLQSAMLDRDDLVGAFEAACAADPAFLFPYYSGFAFHGDRSWANRHIAPYDAGEIARLFRRRLGDHVVVDTVLPGDVLQVEGRAVRKLQAASPFSRPLSGRAVERWEPIDRTTLKGLHEPHERTWLAMELRKLLGEDVLPWVMAHLTENTGLFDTYRDLQAVWQCVVHVGEGLRLEHSVDFRHQPPLLQPDHAHPDANVFSHISGFDLLQVLRGSAGAEVFWMAGGYRMYEKLLSVEGGRFRAPPVAGWDLFERLPDPVTHFLRKNGTRRQAG
ncbi:MAG: MBL fold metallo-hydrolase [Betaproteobacteria bacterium]